MKIFSASHVFDYSWEEVSTGNWRKYCPWNRETEHVIAVDTLSRSIDKDTGILRTERLITCKQAAPRWIQPFLGGAEVSYVYEVSYVTPPPPSHPAIASNRSSTSSTAPSLSSSISSLSASSSILSPNRSNAPEQPAKGGLQNGSAAEKSLVSPPTDPLPTRISNSSPKVVMTSQNLTWSDLLSVRETVEYEPHPSSPHNKTIFRQKAEITALCGGWAKIRQKVEDFTVERFKQNAEKGKRGFEEVLEMSRRVFAEERNKVAATV